MSLFILHWLEIASFELCTNNGTLFSLSFFFFCFDFEFYFISFEKLKLFCLKKSSHPSAYLSSFLFWILNRLKKIYYQQRVENWMRNKFLNWWMTIFFLLLFATATNFIDQTFDFAFVILCCLIFALIVVKVKIAEIVESVEGTYVHKFNFIVAKVDEF